MQLPTDGCKNKADFVTLFVTLEMKNGPELLQSHFLAEREGFEPPEPFSSTVFKTAVIDHSTTSPSALGTAKIDNYSDNAKKGE